MEEDIFYGGLRFPKIKASTLLKGVKSLLSSRSTLDIKKAKQTGRLSAKKAAISKASAQRISTVKFKQNKIGAIQQQTPRLESVKRAEIQTKFENPMFRARLEKVLGAKEAAFGKQLSPDELRVKVETKLNEIRSRADARARDNAASARNSLANRNNTVTQASKATLSDRLAKLREDFNNKLNDVRNRITPGSRERIDASNKANDALNLSRTNLDAGGKLHEASERFKKAGGETKNSSDDLQIPQEKGSAADAKNKSKNSLDAERASLDAHTRANAESNKFKEKSGKADTSADDIDNPRRNPTRQDEGEAEANAKNRSKESIDAERLNLEANNKARVKSGELKNKGNKVEDSADNIENPRNRRRGDDNPERYKENDARDRSSDARDRSKKTLAASEGFRNKVKRFLKRILGVLGQLLLIVLPIILVVIPPVRVPPPSPVMPPAPTIIVSPPPPIIPPGGGTGDPSDVYVPPGSPGSPGPFPGPGAPGSTSLLPLAALGALGAYGAYRTVRGTESRGNMVFELTEPPSEDISFQVQSNNLEFDGDTTVTFLVSSWDTPVYINYTSTLISSADGITGDTSQNLLAQESRKPSSKGPSLDAYSMTPEEIQKEKERLEKLLNPDTIEYELERIERRMEQRKALLALEPTSGGYNEYRGVVEPTYDTVEEKEETIEPTYDDGDYKVLEDKVYPSEKIITEETYEPIEEIVEPVYDIGYKPYEENVVPTLEGGEEESDIPELDYDTIAERITAANLTDDYKAEIFFTLIEDVSTEINIMVSIVEPIWTIQPNIITFNSEIPSTSSFFFSEEVFVALQNLYVEQTINDAEENFNEGLDGQYESGMANISYQEQQRRLKEEQVYNNTYNQTYAEEMSRAADAEVLLKQMGGYSNANLSKLYNKTRKLSRKMKQ